MYLAKIARAFLHIPPPLSTLLLLQFFIHFFIFKMLTQSL